MGGHISVGVRRKDGSFQTMGVWTNPLRHYIQDEAFMKGSLAPLNEFFAGYLKPDVDDQHEGYGPQSNTPGEYGYVLIDEVEHKITDWQHYADLGHVSDHSLSLTHDDEKTVEYRDVIRRYFSHVRIYHVATKLSSVETVPRFNNDEEFVSYVNLLRERDAEVKTVHHGNKAGTSHQYTDHNWVRFTVGFPAWDLVSLDSRSVEGFDDMLSAVERCVELTDDEREVWADERSSLIGLIAE